jgi:hypothetical protein
MASAVEFRAPSGSFISKKKKTLRCLAALLGLDGQRKFLSGFASVWRLTETAVIGLRALGQITVAIAMSLGGKLLASSHGCQEGCIF